MENWESRDDFPEKEPGPEREKIRVPRPMTPCYGYTVDSQGQLQVHRGQADIVFFIFDSFISGQSLGQIAAKLEKMGVPSPSGRTTWSRATLAKLLSNEKYVGDVVVGKSRGGARSGQLPVQPPRLLRDHHQALISRRVFDLAPREQPRRSQTK